MPFPSTSTGPRLVSAIIRVSVAWSAVLAIGEAGAIVDGGGWLAGVVAGVALQELRSATSSAPPASHEAVDRVTMESSS